MLEYIFYLFTLWFKIIVNTFINIHIIWITLPLYLVWFTTEIFQEKKETSYGNAATNGVITAYVGLDWIRQMIMRNVAFSLEKLFIAIITISYGIFVTFEAIKKKPVAKYLGRIKYVNYFQIMFTVLVYSEYTGIAFNLDSMLAILIGFPIIWLITKLLDKYLPDITEEKIEETTKFDIYGGDSYNWSRWGR